MKTVIKKQGAKRKIHRAQITMHLLKLKDR